MAALLVDGTQAEEGLRLPHEPACCVAAAEHGSEQLLELTWAVLDIAHGLELLRETGQRRAVCGRRNNRHERESAAASHGP